MLNLGPIVGAVTDDQATIWFQAEAPGDFLLSLHDESGAPVPGSPFKMTARFAKSNTAVATVPLPHAYHKFTYDIQTTDGTSLLPDFLENPSFSSAPPPNTGGTFNFGLISCNKMEEYKTLEKKERMWRRMQTVLQDPELGAGLLLAVGDQVYADSAWRKLIRRSNPSLNASRFAYRNVYEEQWEFKAIRSVLANCPTYMTWDDHEIRNSWGSNPTDRSDPKRTRIFRSARDVYRQFQHAHNPSTFDSADLFYGFRYGDVGFFVLDSRGHRNIGRGSRRVLGAAQWKKFNQWLDDQASQLGALFVVTSVPIVHIANQLAKVGGAIVSGLKDQWAHPKNHDERHQLVARLFDVANEYDIPVCLLGGDVHVGTISRIRSSRREHERRPVIYQLTSSPISNRPVSKAAIGLVKASIFTPTRIGSDFEGVALHCMAQRNFGLVNVVFDYDTDRYRLVFNLYGEHEDDPLRYSLPG